ncbi:acyl-CoA-binding protein 2, partial [Metschnikowia bicuspidata]
VSKLAKTPDSSEMLQLYGLYKQAISGDNKTPVPLAINFITKQKWLAWNKQNGKSREDAEKEYIALVDQLSVK